MRTEIRPELSFPAEEMNRISRVYDSARIILEYGSGGSTVLGSERPGKLVFSVESDRAWAIRLQHKIDLHNLPSPFWQILVASSNARPFAGAGSL